MNKDEQVKELHCFPFGRGSVGGRPKLPIEAEIKSVYGQVTVFSLPHACLAAGLIGKDLVKDQVVNGADLRDSQPSNGIILWIDFFNDLNAMGVDRQTIAKKNMSFKAPL